MTQADRTDQDYSNEEGLVALSHLFPIQTVPDHARRTRRILDEILRERLKTGAVLYATARSNSMAPLFRIGDRFGLTWKPLTQIQVGDIIAHRVGNGYKVHRVVSLSPVRTRGDANNVPDLPVTEDAYVGIVVSRIRKGAELRLDTGAGILVSKTCSFAAKIRVRLGSPKTHARALIIRIASLPFFERFFQSVTRLALNIVVSHLTQVPDVVSIYARRSYATGDYRPGQSDLDLTIVCREASHSVLTRISLKLASLKRWLPFLGEALLLSEEELEFWAQFDRRGFETRQWKLAGGRDRRLPDYQFEPIRYGLDILSELHHVTLLLASILRKSVMRDSVSLFHRLETVKLLHDLCRYSFALDFDAERLREGIPTRATIAAHISDDDIRAVFVGLSGLARESDDGFSVAFWRALVQIYEWSAGRVSWFLENFPELSHFSIPPPDCYREDDASHVGASFYTFGNAQYLSLSTQSLKLLSVATLRALYCEYDCVTSRLVICPTALFRAFALCSPKVLSAVIETAALPSNLRMLLRARQAASLTALLNAAACPGGSSARMLLVDAGSEWATVTTEIERITNAKIHSATNGYSPLITASNRLCFSSSAGGPPPSDRDCSSDHKRLSTALGNERRDIYATIKNTMRAHAHD